VYGQLGDGTITQRPTPAALSGLANGMTVAASGWEHTCALTSAGGVVCWGRNNFGQLGDGTTIDRATPAPVSGLASGVIAITAGEGHACALTEVGSLLCWGENGHGQLGDGSVTGRTTPTGVYGLGSGVAAVAAGSDFTCAMTTAGGVLCWGNNDTGNLGDGTQDDAHTPRAVSGLGSGAISIDAGQRHACAALTGGGAVCWGENQYGQLGDGTVAFKATPTVVTGLSGGIDMLAAGRTHTCALTALGGVECWGRNDRGQVGDGTTTNRLTPAAVSGLASGVVSLSAGDDYTCALTALGGVACWGQNAYGQLGDGTTADRLTPTYVGGLFLGVASVSSGQYHACAVKAGGSVICWGDDSAGQLGLGTRVLSAVPVPAYGLGGSVTVSSITPSHGSGSGGTAVTITGACFVQGATVTIGGTPATSVTVVNTETIVATTGPHAAGTVDVQVQNPGGALATLEGAFTYDVPDAPPRSRAEITAYADHSCSITSGGGVVCWGYNNRGQIGDGTTTNRLTPTAVAGLWSGVTAVTVGSHHSCALRSTGGVVCWGYNNRGQIGDGTTANRLTPVPVTGMTSGVVAIASGDSHTCAVTTSGAVVCWGYNFDGELGDGSTTDRLTPVSVDSLASGAVSVTGGQTHTCALTTAGAVLCWGGNTSGQLGDGTTAGRLTPVHVSGLQGGVIAVTASHMHTCALRAGGGVVCWGNNGQGQLGDGTTADRSTPVPVTGLSNGIAAVETGFYHSCALTAGGGVACWGDNGWGQLGDDSTLNRSTPVAVQGLASGAEELAAGQSHSCARLVSGRVLCWGFNGNGELGDGTTSDHPTPAEVSGTAGNAASAAPIAGGDQHTCTLTPAGGVQCSGANAYGQLGDGTTTPRLTLTAVSGLTSGVAAVAAGAYHTCALTLSGTVACWGYNYFGQLGDGTTTNRLTPAAVSGLGNGAVALAAGWFHTCALTPAGGVVCWGRNTNGQLGDGTTTDRSAPKAVSGLASGAVAIAAGAYHTCAVTTAGSLLCWGYNAYGQLGDGTSTSRPTPTAVSGLSHGVAAVEAAFRHTCALTTSGAVLCWGDNFYGQLGDGSTTQRITPTAVSGLGSGAGALSGGADHNCALTSGGGVLCWGRNIEGQLGDGTTTSRSTPTAVSGLGGGVTSIAGGHSHTCAVTPGGLACWGANDAGQLGDGTTTQRSTPAAAAGLASAPAPVTLGQTHACALTPVGGVVCWGSNSYGQLGNGTTVDRSTPTAVSGLATGVAVVVAGGSHTCALTTAGGVTCWGWNIYGQLGDGSTTNRTTPVSVYGLSSGVAAIAAGYRHTCALTTSGAAVCWGWNAAGQVGDGTTTDRTAPTAVTGLWSDVAAIAAGNAFTCAVKDGGGVSCWGYNGYGQLGDGTTTNRTAPTAVGGLTAAGIAAGHFHTCALTADGAAACWGSNSDGQLGDGTRTGRSTPAAVSGLESGVAAVTTGGYHSCALTSGGGVKCWGYNAEGQVGDGTTAERLTPTAPGGLAGGVSALVAGEISTCAVSVGGAVQCWGDNSRGELGVGSILQRSTPVLTRGLEAGAQALAMGAYHTCTLTAAGGVLCWGYNLQGQLGDGTTTNRSTPGPVSGLASGITSVKAGTSQACALTSAGGIWCWGDNEYGGIGDGTTTERLTATPVLGLGSGVAAIAVGGYHACAVSAAGGLLCWGMDYYGQLGDGTTTDRATPGAVSGLGSGVAAVAASDMHTCAVTTGGGLLCWGDNNYGQLGDGTTTDRWTPVSVAGLGSGVAAVATGDYHTCALTTSGGVKCWGSNSSGQLGDGTTTQRWAPVTVTGLESGAIAVTAGAYHSCALKTGGAVVCWGYNRLGGLGDGTTSGRLTPVDVNGMQAGVSAIEAAKFSTCALKSGGIVWCWGDDWAGELGLGTRTFSTTPVALYGRGGAIAAGSITPSSGTTGGGSTVTITGGYFLEGATVTIGGVPASDVIVVTDGTITATTGAHAPGVVDVVVQNPDSTQATLAGGFTYTLPPPGAFSRTAPPPGTTGVATNPTLMWGTSSGAASYEYCYDTSNDNACSAWTSVGSATSAGLGGLAYGTTYYWHARAVNAGGTTYANGSATAYWSFTTQVLPPGAFGKTAPPNGATGVATSPTLTWGTSSGAGRYEYCYDTSNDNACAAWTSVGAATSAGLGSLAYATTYYWHVRAVNAGGPTYADGSATAYWSFTTQVAPPGAFNKTAPVNGATGIATNPTLMWGASTGAASYEYCYDTSNDNACSAWISAGSATGAGLAGLASATTYYWQVRALNAGGVTYADGSAPAFSSFRTRTAVPRDFTGDLKSDILWRHATGGDVWLWPMNGAARTAETYVRTVADTTWEIRGLGDQTGDGKADILWRNKINGQVYLWQMDGATPLDETYVGTVATAYDIVGTGDFNGDGTSDILWRHTALGDVWVWLMGGATPLSEVYVDRVDPGYVVKGVGDLDGDGKADIVWHGAAGDVWVWPMNGTARLDQVWVGSVPDTGYQIQAVADVTGDGKADVVWWHATRGEVWLWTMNGAVRQAETWVATVPETGYRIVGAGDYDGDGKADLLWHHATRGEVWVWLMDGTTRQSQTWVATVPDTGYQIVR
jgi:alpha-tubulin suppressor-like RCC1 family protein